MELYTSLVRLKQCMNGGELPPMTPIPANALSVVDPAFTINGNGMGGLVADEELGLRCPLRGCGEYHHHLRKHLRQTHSGRKNGSYYNAEAVLREALGIPWAVPLLSASLRKELSDRANRRKKVDRKGTMPSGKNHWMHAKDDKYVIAMQRKRAIELIKTRCSVNARNFRDECEAQVTQKLLALYDDNGRTPSMNEARIKHGQTFVKRLMEYFGGSWDAVVANFGFAPLVDKRGNLTTDGALACLRPFYKQHGDLPDFAGARWQYVTPRIRNPQKVIKALKAADWDDAMRRAAALLGIHGGKYGLPEKQQGAA